MLKQNIDFIHGVIVARFYPDKIWKQYFRGLQWLKEIDTFVEYKTTIGMHRRCSVVVFMLVARKIRDERGRWGCIHRSSSAQKKYADVDKYQVKSVIKRLRNHLIIHVIYENLTLPFFFSSCRVYFYQPIESLWLNNFGKFYAFTFVIIIFFILQFSLENREMAIHILA